MSIVPAATVAGAVHVGAAISVTVGVVAIGATDEVVVATAVHMRWSHR